MSIAGLPVRSIVRAVADAAARWSDADFPARVRLLDAICARTGYSLPVVEYGLDRLFFPMTEPGVLATIAGELGSTDVLDRFVDGMRALPAGRVCIISSRTTIGVAIVPAIFALCAKCEVLVKDREDGLVAAFFATLAEELDELGLAARAQAWNSGSDARDLSDFDVVVAFGDDATLAQIRRDLPASTHFIGYGSKASCGYVTRESLGDPGDAKAIAAGAARDLVLYDTEGCMSLHALFVERGGPIAPEDFAQTLARAIERAAVEFPPGTHDAATAARVASTRDLAAFRAATGTGTVFSDRDASYVAVLEPPVAQPPMFLPRSLAIYPVDAPADARAYLARHRLPIEAFALSSQRDDAIQMAQAIGASRISRFGDLQSPPISARHGGRGRITEFVRWIGDET